MEIFIQDFDKIMDCFQISQVIVENIHTNAEIEPSISSVYNLVIAELKIRPTVLYFIEWECHLQLYLYEVGVFGITNGNDSMYFFNQLLLFFIVEVHVPFRETSFAGSILNQDKANL